ncbi:MAG: hypothetical protein ACFFCL_15740 [Promethearchaeota archaeon]
MLHAKSSKLPKGRNKTVSIIVKIRLINPIYNPHNRFLKRPIVEITRIKVNAQKIGANVKGWDSNNCCIRGTLNLKTKYRFGIKFRAIRIIIILSDSSRIE